VSDIALSEEVDERQGVEVAIAEGLAELSEVDPVPAEVDAGSSFTAEDVTFDGTGWLPYVIRVQDWLRLSSRIDPASSPGEGAARLFSALGAEPATDAITVAGDAILSITQQGLTLLGDRVERAVDLKDKFLEAVEAGSIDAATSVWIDEWDDTVESTISGPIVAKASTWSISDFAAKAKSRRLQLDPAYQRSDVWPTKDAQLLIESILRGIPLPSVIVLRPEKDAPFEVVDGKQRLTSILRFMGAHPDALQKVAEKSAVHPHAKLKSLFQSDYRKFRIAWKNATGKSLTTTLESQYYFPFKLSSTSKALTGDLESLAGKYYDQIRDTRVRVGGEHLDVEEVFETSTDYKIPVIEYTEATPRQIHEVFSLYNKQGKHLNAEEIRNAVYHEVSLMRALSVAAGDSKLQEAPSFLSGMKVEIKIIQENLDGFGVAAVRYRRTKVLSWLFSILFIPPLDDGQKPAFLSTAQQINNMLDYVQSQATATLRDEATIQGALSLVSSAMETHAASNAWADAFRNAKGAKWQELQLVASLLGLSMAQAVLGDQLDDRVTLHRDELVRKSGTEWRRPEKTQTGRQWKYIATTSLAILEQLEVDADEVEKVMTVEYGSSCVATLRAAAAIAD